MSSGGSSSRRKKLIERIRPAIPAHAVRRSAALLALDATVYAALFTALVAVRAAWPWKALLAAAAGIAIARLFLIGHDACHGAFFPGGRRCLNALAGRLVFLPSLTPYSTWELGHNTLHHGFTNLRGKDYVYTPFSREEFAALPRWRRLLERIYRHPLGPGLHYGLEVWWKRLLFPRASGRPVYLWDSLLTLTFLAAQTAIAIAAARATGQNPYAVAAWAIAVPFAVWNCLMGFVTYQQHTHPDVVWYANRADWDPVTAQVHATVHIQFPRPVSVLLGNIMEHTAHHLDVAIPLFELAEAQRRVEAEFPGEVTVVPWSVRFYLDCCRRCKLYDYDARQWTGFHHAAPLLQIERNHRLAVPQEQPRSGDRRRRPGEVLKHLEA